MRRRDVLRAGGAAVAGAAVAADATATANDGFRPVGRLPLARAKELVVDGDVAYVAATDGFATVDVADPADPTLLAERRGLLSAHPDGPLEAVYDGKVGGDRYAVGGPGRDGTEEFRAAAVYDVSDPADPAHVLTHETDFYHHNLDTDGETLYLCGNDGDRNPLVCVDVASGAELGRWSVLEEDDRWADVDPHLREMHDVWVEDGVAYVAYWNAGTWLVDVSDPADPTPLDSLRGLNPAEQAEIDGDEAVRRARFGLPGNDHFAMPQRGGDGDLLALNEEAWGESADAPVSDIGGVELWDVAREERLARIEAPPTDDATYGGVWTTPHNFALVGDHLYTSWYRGGVKVHDVSEPTRPELVGHWRDSGTTDFWTAQRADGCVVATSWRDHSADDPEAAAAVYTFPAPEDVPVAGTGTESGAVADGAGGGLLAGAAGMGLGAGLAALARRWRS